jgi:hypothetical protein
MPTVHKCLPHKYFVLESRRDWSSKGTLHILRSVRAKLHCRRLHRITRKRHEGTVERFSDPMKYLLLQHRQNTSKRVREVQKAFPNTEEYLKWIKTRQNQPHKSKSGLS